MGTNNESEVILIEWWGSAQLTYLAKQVACMCVRACKAQNYISGMLYTFLPYTLEEVLDELSESIGQLIMWLEINSISIVFESM